MTDLSCWVRVLLMTLKRKSYSSNNKSQKKTEKDRKIQKKTEKDRKRQRDKKRLAKKTLLIQNPAEPTPVVLLLLPKLLTKFLIAMFCGAMTNMFRFNNEIVLPLHLRLCEVLSSRLTLPVTCCFHCKNISWESRTAIRKQQFISMSHRKNTPTLSI